MGVDSCGMLLSAVHEVGGEERLHLLMLDDAILARGRGGASVDRRTRLAEFPQVATSCVN